jgi:anti-anti-sigma regulatory factor
MLKITIDETATTATMKLEGRVAGAWVQEFEKSWESMGQVLGPRKLTVDLSGVTYMDLDARDLLAKIHAKTGADLLSKAPLVNYFVEQARRSKTERMEEK